MKIQEDHVAPTAKQHNSDPVLEPERPAGQPGQADTAEYGAADRWPTWKLAAAAVALMCLVGGGFWYWEYSTLHPSTSNSYIGANIVRIAPLVGGRISSVNVRDYQKVSAGDILVAIDKKPLQIALDSAKARLELAQQQAAAAKSAVSVAEARLIEARANLADIEKQTARTETLAQKGDASTAEHDDSVARLKTARATVAAAEATLRQAQEKLGATGEANANVKAANAQVASAELDLGYATIKAPVDGIVGKVGVRPGSVVATGTALFPLVETGHWWVDANFKETDLQRIKPGQPAEVTVDIYPSHRIKGVVEALSPASGAAFSLLPPENATGNWVKVTQRFPVRVRLKTDDDTPPLRIGASASVTINTVDLSKSGRT